MTVVIEDSSIIGGTSDDLFVNNGGQLSISNLDVTGTTAESMIVTTNRGTSTLLDSTVTASSIQHVTKTQSEGTQNVEGVNVNNMVLMDRTFSVAGTGSRLVVERTTVEDNQPSSTWRGIDVQAGATAQMRRDSLFSGNTNMQYGVIAGSRAFVEVLDSFFTNNVGLGVSVTIEKNWISHSLNERRLMVSFQQAEASAAVATIGGEVNVERTEFDGNRQFSVSNVHICQSLKNTENNLQV